MAHPTPHVEHGVLTLEPGASAITVGTQAWFRWLEQATAFSFTSPQGGFTARRERASSGRGGWYWRAYLHRDGARQRVYLGLAAELSLERLETVAAQLASARPASDSQRTAPGARPRPETKGSTPQLLATKLYLPRTRPDLIVRPQLFTRLNEGLNGTLTLVCAPAGFGKTTLVTAWVRHTRRPTAWLALDRGDNDLVVFLRYLVAALQSLAPQVGSGLSGLLQSPPPPPETLLTALLNDLTELPPDSLLVLDDYHVLEAAPVHQAVGFLLDHLPPTLHLVIATRADPPLALARLRARRQVTELRTEQLRFRPEEVTAFLTEGMGLALTAADTAALAARTEGWIAGLQLAAIAMRDLDDQAGFIAAFTGSNRYIVDYLVDEVLSSQPPQIQRFLLRTSILERMCGSLCDVVTGIEQREGSIEHAEGDAQLSLRSVHNAQLNLEQLERANLFVIPLDAERRWYRYHHLFAEVLRERLRRGTPAHTVAALHQQASAWYAHSGLIPEAIQHAFAAEVPDTAAQLIEAHGHQLIAQGEIQSLLRWLRQLPDATLRTRPRLLILLCWLLPNTGALDEVAHYRAEAEALLAETADLALRSEFLALQLQPLVFQDRTDEVIAIGTQVLTYLSTDHFFHSVSGVMTGLALLRQSRLAEAEQTLTRAVAEAYANRALYFVVSGLARLGIVAVERGAFALAAQRYEEAVAACRGGQGVLSPIAGMALVGLGRLRGLQGRVNDGIQLLEQALTLCEQLNAAPFFFLDGHTGLAELYATSGRVPEALQQLALAEERLRRFANPVFLDTIAAYRASIWRAQADPAFVTWLHAHRMAVNVREAEVRDKEYVTRIRGLIDSGQGKAALELIAELAAFARTMGRVRSRVDLDVLCAMALAHQGDAQAAQVALNQALELAAPMGYISIFLEEGAPMVALLEAQSARRKAQSDPLQHFSVQLLAAFGHTAGAQRDGEPAGVRSALGRSNALLEPLTARELEVLRLVADGASNGEIARRLIVSIGTVKKHTANIFGKLAVQSRTQAVARARALGLL